MRLLGVLLMLVGCHGAGSVAPDGSTEPDVPPRSRGLTVTWRARPGVPGMITDKVTVTDVVFQLQHLQLISDASSDQTTQGPLELEWSSNGSPSNNVFPNAPVAHYQQLLLDMRSDRPPFSYAYQIQGMWQDGGNSRPFQIVDPTILEVPVMCDVMLPANGSMTVAVELDLRDALDGIDFKSLPSDHGMLVLNGGPQLLELRDQLMHHAFEIDN